MTQKKGRKARVGVIEVSCLDVCPKGGVMVIDTRCPGIWRIVRPEADMDQLTREIENWCDQA